MAAESADIRQRRLKLAELDRRRRKQARRANKLEARQNRISRRLRQLRDRPALENALRRRLQQTKQRSLLVAGRLDQTKQKMRQIRRVKETVPGKPGVPSPTIEPFMTAEDIQAENEARQRLQSTLFDLDHQLATRAADAAYEKQQIEREATRSRADANARAASRGLFHSSIRDAELYDIDATASLRRSQLDRELDTLALEAGRQKLAAQQAFDDFQHALQQKMVENAQQRSLELGLGPWLEEPVPDRTRVRKLKPLRRPPAARGRTKVGRGRYTKKEARRRG